MFLFLQLLINALAVLTGAYILKGVKVDGFVTAVVVAIVLGLLNTFLKPHPYFPDAPHHSHHLGSFPSRDQRGNHFARGQAGFGISGGEFLVGAGLQFCDFHRGLFPDVVRLNPS